MLKAIARGILAGSCLIGFSPAAFSQVMTINDAMRMAVQTHPQIGEAAANRKATEAELHQAQGQLLPQVRLQATAGPTRTNERDVVFPPPGNNQWLPGSEYSLIVRQLLFDGFQSINEIWRQTARTDSAAARVHERSELSALDAAEAYVDVVRYTRLASLAAENVRAHSTILSNVQQRFQGGRAGEGDLEQTRERVLAAQAAEVEFRRSLEDARAKFRKAVGLDALSLRMPSRLAGMPPNKDRALAVTLTNNPTLQAAQRDADAAKFAFRGTSGNFLPKVSLEGRTTTGNNLENIPGHYSISSLQAVATWDIFDGFQNGWKREEAGQRFIQANMAHARLQRDAFESVDKAWAARTITGERIAKLSSQIASDRRVISAYSKEYDLGQRSLIDLLNAENQLFNAQVSLESARGVAVFADYQLLATMGELLNYIRAPHPVDAEPLVPKNWVWGLIPDRLPRMLFHVPPGPEPINVVATPVVPAIDVSPEPQPLRPSEFSERWSALAASPQPALSYAPEIFSPKALGLPTFFGAPSQTEEATSAAPAQTAEAK